MQPQDLYALVNGLLQEWKDKIEVGQFKEALQTHNEFYRALLSLPPEYKSVRVKFKLDAKNDPEYPPHSNRTPQILEQLQRFFDVGPPSEDLEYELDVLLPRQPSIEGITSGHGSPVRDGFFSQGVIETICDGPIGLIDPKTNYETVVLINPTNIGGFSMNKRLGQYFLFPRQILGLALRTEIPGYLNEAEMACVHNFYSGKF